MTISKPQVRKKNSPPTLELSGSQISLSPRPMPVTHVTWSSNYRSYPIRRSMSAFGFQQEDEERMHVGSSRPLSADNIRYINRKSCTNDCRSEITISSSSQDFNKTCVLSENMFENIVNGYSEKKRILEYQNSEGNLKPGLSSKPPLPPCNADTKSSLKSDTEMDNLADRVETMKSAAEKEAFDEIIALKFQRWFPNTNTHLPEASSTDDENDVELLSYKERNFQTCEYRYEILRKNTAKNAPQERKKSTFKSKRTKKLIPKKASASPTNSTSPRANQITNVDTKTLANYRRENTATPTIDTRSPEARNSGSPRNENKHDNSDVNEKFVALKEQHNEKTTTDKFVLLDGKNSPLAEIADAKPKQLKTSFLKKSNFQSPLASPLKKQKKISFSVDKKNQSDFVEPYFATKNGQSETAENGQQIADENREKSKVRDMMVSPQQPAGSQIEDVMSWMGTHRVTPTTVNVVVTPETDFNNSMYEEMMGILKDIEKEDIKDELKLNEPSSSKIIAPPSPAKAIWSLIEEAEKNNNITDTLDSNGNSEHMIPTRDTEAGSCKPEEKNWNRLSDLLRFPSTELAQKVMALQMLLDERETTLYNLTDRLKTTQQTYQQQKQELEYSVHKQQKLIEQLKNEKKSAIERLENTLSELEKKHATSLVALDERHKMELKKNLEKQAAADKLERERWLEMKTQKIKELAIKGLEPELNRMAAAHQEEIAEIRKFYKRQIEETEEALNRRMTVQKEKMEAEKEKALAIEREMSRQKLEDEIGELEKRFQEQRKRLLAEVHVERENMERENEATLAIKEKENERKWEKKSIEMQKKIEALQNQHQEEIKKLQQNFEAEKQMWMKNQMIELSEKENKIKEQCKKERDKHIELIIQKLEHENLQREQNSEQKVKRLKEQYEAEIHDMELANENLRRKLNETRSEIQKSEDIVSQLRAQLNQSQTEYVILKEKYDRVLAEQGEMQNMAKSELTTRVHILQSELNQAQLTYESQMKSLKSENERELSQMYSRFKEVLSKKEDFINTLKKQKDAAFQQCNQLEKLLELKRAKDHTHK